MGIIDAYDEGEEIIKAENIAKDLKKLPSIAVVFFKYELIHYIEKNKNFKLYSSFKVCGEERPIYISQVNGKEFIIYRTAFGAPATISIMEEMIARGVKKFIFFGSCGVLDNNVLHNSIILPNKAYRDEGTSYHYLPAADYIDVSTYDELAKIFDKNNIKYATTGTWSIDAFYKETKQKVKKRLSLGDKIVEMECSAIMAVSKVRNVKSYCFFYTDDTLAGEEWDERTLKKDRSSMLIECLNISRKIIENID